MKLLSQNEISRLQNRPAMRSAFAALMWRTLPGVSLREKAERAAPLLNLSVKQCENLLQGQNDAKLLTVVTMLSVAAGESLFDLVDRLSGSRKP